MSVMISLSALENNDTTYVMQVTYNTAPINTPFFGMQTPFSLTGYTPKVLTKASSATPDASATTYTVGSGLTLVSALLGEISWVLPHTASIVQTPGTYWWRLDLVDGSGNVGTALYGNLYVIAV